MVVGKFVEQGRSPSLRLGASLLSSGSHGGESLVSRNGVNFWIVFWILKTLVNGRILDRVNA